MRTEMKGGGESVRARLKGVIKVDMASGSIFMLQIPAYHLTTLFNACFVADC